MASTCAPPMQRIVGRCSPDRPLFAVDQRDANAECAEVDAGNDGHENSPPVVSPGKTLPERSSDYTMARHFVVDGSCLPLNSAARRGECVAPLRRAASTRNENYFFAGAGLGAGAGFFAAVAVCVFAAVSLMAGPT